VEPTRSDRARPLGDADDVLLERLTAIVSVLDPLPTAVQEEARRRFVASKLVLSSVEPAPVPTD
jgi:hypothetical protein